MTREFPYYADCYAHSRSFIPLTGENLNHDFFYDFFLLCSFYFLTYSLTLSNDFASIFRTLFLTFLIP